MTTIFFCANQMIAVSITSGTSKHSVTDKIIRFSGGEKPTIQTVPILTSHGDIPAFFDARIKWGKICPFIGKVKNQGICKSGWAIAVADVITDRRCIKSGGKFQDKLSPMHLLSCCTNCCGCNGGHILNAWRFVLHEGLVTGGTYPEHPTFVPSDGCQPYQIRPLMESELNKSSTFGSRTPACKGIKCSNPKYYREEQTVFKIRSFSLLPRSNPEIIMREIMENGPVQVSFHMHEDFRLYRGGHHNKIFAHVWGKLENEHAAKLIGWGTYDDVNYWLLMNSFSRNWGENGTFRVHRTRSDHFDFGYAIIAPSISKSSSTENYVYLIIIIKIILFLKF
ncbi:cathepsin B-like [Daktulosphaira vitifoliae]|uniref:cathepsin B-like n=1 Tax=Daktulosphaira vitifoliae TaxID=58002 RepID=UPI0021AAC6BC|nr:cathepsin B-like [Daktulosphaira vitifoliae]